jgi:hypothetical protein
MLSAARRSAASAAKYWATVEAVMLATMLELRSKNYEVERVRRKITQTGLARLAGGIMAPKK